MIKSNKTSNILIKVFVIKLIFLTNLVLMDRTNIHLIDSKINFIFIDKVCEHKIQNDKIDCVRDSASQWEDIEDRERAGCCTSWDINDCILKSVSEKCDSITYNRIKRFLDQQNKDHSQGLCENYVYGSYKCHFPVWAIVLIVVFGLITALVTGFLFCFCFYQKQTISYF